MARKLVAIFVRHGSTALNEQHKFRGPIDVDLDQKGISQAQDIADQTGGRVFSIAFTSSKKRAKQTADIVLENHRDVPRREIKELDSLNVGEFAGQDKSPENMDKIRHYQDNPSEVIPGGESLDAFRKRTDPAILAVVKYGEQSGRPAVAFVHSSIVHEIGNLFHEDHEFVKVKPGGIVGVFRTPNGYEAKALYLESHGNKDKDFVS